MEPTRNATSSFMRPSENLHAAKQRTFPMRKFMPSKDANSSVPEEMQPIATEAAKDAFAPEIHAPTSSTEPSTPDATMFPLPRITIPSLQRPQSTAKPAQTDGHLPSTGQAIAQLTLGFGITSLQLTAFFRLGSVQLKALSNVVSLHLVGAQGTDRPLAAGISFQIEQVDLDDAACLKSIQLKPLSEAREMAAPMPNFQVEGVAVNGGKDAPISVTASGAISTAVHLVGTFIITAMEFSRVFEIASLRLEPTSNTVLLRVTSSSGSDAQVLLPSFKMTAVQIGDGSQLLGACLAPIPSTNVSE